MVGTPTLLLGYQAAWDSPTSSQLQFLTSVWRSGTSSSSRVGLTGQILEDSTLGPH